MDCMGNTSKIDTPQGFCVRDIYRPTEIQWYNTDTGERGNVVNGCFVTPSQQRETKKNYKQ